MESKNILIPFNIPCILVLLLSLILSFGNNAKSDITKDRQRCANPLVSIETCLPYVGGESRAPQINCCSGFKQVMQKSPECICLLIKDRNDPSLGLNINATLALTLPDRCNAHGRNISECPTLLHLPPINSPDAKVFKDFANSANKSNTTTTPTAGNPSSGTNQKSDGGKGCLEIEIVSGLLLITILELHMINNV